MQPKRRNMETECALGSETDICKLCGSAVNDEFKFGKKYKHEDIVAHYYCLLFACGLEQNGEDEEGILGFLRKDILKEVARGKRLRCTFCRKTGATSACCLKQCRVMFHFGCGLKGNCLNQFCDDFSSFCIKHRPKQNMSTRYLREHLNDECPVCYLPIAVDKDPGACGFLKTPCCQSLLHRECVQRQALSAGYFFKCPLCNNIKEFTKEMQNFGIYIPEQDASWELEENAFVDLYYRYNKCDAETCECPKGREYDKTGSSWDICICQICASHGAHVRCGRIPVNKLQTWVCPTCANIEYKQTDNPKKRKLSETTNNYEEDRLTSGSSSINHQERRYMSIKRKAASEKNGTRGSPRKGSPRKALV